MGKVRAVGTTPAWRLRLNGLIRSLHNAAAMARAFEEELPILEGAMAHKIEALLRDAKDIKQRIDDGEV